MALPYTFNASEIAAGQPVKQELWQGVKDDFEDLDTRVSAVEAATSTVQPLIFAVTGPHFLYGAVNEVCVIRAPYSLTLTDVKLFVVQGGTDGTLLVDIQKKSGAGAYATVFSTKPSVIFSAGNYATSTNAAISVPAVSNGDFLRLDINTVMTQCSEFYVFLYHTVGI